MLAKPYLSVIIPAFNEAKSIQRTVSSIQRFLDRRGCSHEIIVSADGNDGTRELVAEMGRNNPNISIIGSTQRRGKGYGIRQAIPRARGEIVGFLDADYKVAIDEIDKILPWFQEGYDIVIGSRNVADSEITTGQPWFRRLGSKLFGFGMHLLVGLREIRDTQCGFKFFRSHIAKDLFSRQRIDGYMYDVEILYMAAHAGYRVKEVGVSWKDDGDSRLSLVSGNWKNLKDIFRIRFGNTNLTPSVADVETVFENKYAA